MSSKPLVQGIFPVTYNNTYNNSVTVFIFPYNFNG